MRVLALDLATRTGWASWDGARRESGVKDFTPRRGDSVGMIWLEFNGWLEHLAGLARPDLVIWEKPFAFTGPAQRIAFGMVTRAEEWCARKTPPVTHCSLNATTLKKWTTGRGNAKKPDMVSAVNERFGPPFVTDDNEADARALLAYALETYGGQA